MFIRKLIFQPNIPAFGLALGLLFLLSSTVQAQVSLDHLSLDQDDQMENLGIFIPGFFAELQDLQIIDDLAYVFGVGGLAILDISNTDNPIQLGRYTPPGHPYVRFYRGAVLNNIAVGGAREDLAFIMDVTQPMNPQVVSWHGFAGQSFEGVALGGQPGSELAYLCAHADGLEIVDVSFLPDPRHLSSVTSLTNAWDVALHGNYAYVADGAGGLAVIDITHPEAPVHVTSMPTSGSAADVVTDGSVLVVSCGSAGIDIFTLDNPADPAPAGTANTSGLAITAALAGNKAYVADWDDVEVFDLTDPANPQPVGGENTPVRAMGLDAVEVQSEIQGENLVAVADWSRVRLYRSGPTTEADIAVSVESLVFEDVPDGAIADETFTIGNTGGGDLHVQQITSFNFNFEVLPPTFFTLEPGQTQEVTVRFTRDGPGFDGTFLRIDSNDSDESQVSFSLSSDDNPNQLDIGDPAPGFSLPDLEGVTHTLAEHQGRVVVMAYFANW